MTSRIPANISEIAFDVIIIGAGINGAGIARDASMRGLKVLLLDKGDIGGGTTSWSTRLIHGGLRYLEHGEFGLVRESLREREILFRIAPHLVKPLPILMPIYERSRRGPLTLRVGMIAYDLLSFEKSLPRHHMLTREQVLAQAPGLNPVGLRGAAVYYDAQVEFAERLVVENVLSAKERGATVATYARVEKTTVLNDSFHLQVTDVVRGAMFEASARIVVNAAGPWVDQLLEGDRLVDVARVPEDKEDHSERLIGGTKGSHIIVAPFPGAPASALYVEARADSRPFFIIPWNCNYLIGTTDIRYQGNLDHVEIEDAEIKYLLKETNSVIPTANLCSDSILFTYSGVRPLPFTEHEDEQSITRRHFIREHPHFPSFISIVGGKLTTYRSLAQETVDLIVRKLAAKVSRCATATTPLPGAANFGSDFAAFVKELQESSGLSAATVNRLLRIYGARALEISKLLAQEPSLEEVFCSETGAIAAEVVFSFENELAQTLSDSLLRRTMVGLNSSAGIGAVETAAKVAQKHLGWSENRAEQEVAAYRLHLRRFHPHMLGKVENDSPRTKEPGRV